MNSVEEGPTPSEESELLPVDQQPAHRCGIWRALPLALALVAATAVIAYAPVHSQNLHSQNLLQRVAARPEFSELVGSAALQDNPCALLPWLQIDSVKRNNLGNGGPERDVPEGIVYGATAFNTGMNNTDLEIHLNVVAGTYFGKVNFSHLPRHPSALYEPEWPKDNGIKGKFAVINLHPGTNVTLMVRGFDPAKQRYIKLPRWAIAFFDFDTGKNGTQSVEFLKMNNYVNYFVTNDTELNMDESGEGVKLTATVEGDGDDNPDDPLALTVLQKNRAVSFVFEDTDHVIFEVGASPGHQPRVFQFVLGPSLRCANTVISKDNIIAFDDTSSPISIVKHERGGANQHAQPAANRKHERSGANQHAQPAAMVMMGLAVLAVQHML